jgi:hypothetical protein
MKKWTMMTLAAPLALIASQALAEDWIAIGTGSDGSSIRIDKDSIRRGSDGLIYWTDKLTTRDVTGDLKSQNAADCQKRIYYPISLGGVDLPNWRGKGQTDPSSAAKSELQYACANAG